MIEVLQMLQMKVAKLIAEAEVLVYDDLGAQVGMAVERHYSAAPDHCLAAICSRKSNS